ncbi:MAG TPA: outer membrane beta-barrel protein [Woeseiaceae bacterium]|nr:outer membrane beta-barrel protein [Woeseiaceae bacterium]
MWRFMLCVALIPLSEAALAEDFDYSFVQASYGQIDFDDLDVDGDALGISGSFAINDSFHIFGGYETGDLDFGIDVNTFEAGLGFNTPLTDTVDLVAGLSYITTEVEVSGFGSADDDGYGLDAGLRAMVSPVVELNGGISYVDFGDGGDDTAFGAGFRYYFSDAFSVGLSGSWGDDTSTYGVGGRYSFGQ